MSDALADPFLALVDIDARCRVGSTLLPRQENPDDYWSGVVFVLNGEHFVAPLTEVFEIMHMPVLTKVPGARAWLKGIANVRAMLVPVADLLAFLGKRPSFSRRQRVLVIHQESTPVGVIVDDVIGLQHFEQSQRMDSAVHIDDALRPFILGAFAREDKVWPVFSPQALTRHASFKLVAL